MRAAPRGDTVVGSEAQQDDAAGQPGGLAPLHGPKRLLRVLTVLSVGVLVASATWFAWHERQRELDNASALSVRRAERLSEELGETLDLARHAIAQSEAELQRLPAGAQLPAALGDAARVRAGLLSHLPMPFELHALDADGRVIELAPVPTDADPTASASRPKATAHDHPRPATAQRGWQIGAAQGPAGARIVPLMRVAAPNPHGIAAYGVDLLHGPLLERFEQSRIPRGGGVALFRLEPDGATTLLARAPHSEAELGRTVRGPLAQALARTPRGTFHAHTQLDNTHRLIAYRRLEGDAADLVVAYGMATDVLLAGWRDQLPWMAALTLLLGAVLGTSGWRLERSLQTQARQHEALARSERNYRALADNLPDVFVRLDRQGRHLYANAAVEAATGLPPASFIGRTNAEMGMPAETVGVWMAALRRAFERRASERIEFEFSGPNGTRHWESVVAPEPVAAGEPDTALVISRDITERRLNAEALRASEARHRELFESNPHPMWVYDLETLAFLAVNDAAVRQYGYSHDEFLQMTIKDIRPADDVAKLLENIAGVTGGLDEAGIWRHRTKDGRLLEVEITSHTLAFHGRPAELVLALDVTRRNQIERLLRDREERLRLALEAAQQGLYDLDVRTGQVVVSPEYARMLGWDPEDFQESHAAWRDRLHPADRDAVTRVYDDYLAGRRADYRVEFRQRVRSGGWKWILSVGRIQERDAQGNPLRMLGTHTDITAIKEAQAALQDSEERFRVLFDASPVPTLAYERGSLRLLAVNEAFMRLYGYSRDEALDLRIPDLYPAERRAEIVELAARVSGLNHVTEIQHVRKDGRRIDVETRSHDYASDGRPGRISVIVDVTEQRRAQAERRAAAERFETLFRAAPEAISVSELASGRFVQVNDAFCELFGLAREQVIGRTARELDLWTVPQDRDDIVRRLRAGAGVRGHEGAIRKRSGETIDVLYSAERIDFDGREALLLMFRDISQRKRLEAALRASESRLAHLLSRAPTVIYTAKAEGDFAATYYSPNTSAMLGWAPEHFVQNGAFWLDHLHPDDRPGVLRVMDDLRKSDELMLEYRFQHADGRWRWMRDQVSVQRDAGGAPIELVGAWVDITERREAEDQVRRLAAELEQRVQERTAQLALSEARFRTIFEDVPVAITEEDWSGVQQLLRALRARGVNDGPAHFASHPEFVQQCLRAVRVVRLNQKALLMHDAEDQQRDLPDLQAFYPDAKELSQFVGELEAMWAGQRTYTAKRRLPSVSGRPLNLMMTISLPALEGDDAMALVCLVDITEIDRLNAELDRSLARLRQVNKELETFTYSVSHDLKAPLRGIDGYSRLLLSDHAQALNEEGRQFLGHIRHATQHMGVLIDDLLAYSRLERRELTLTALSLVTVVDGVLAPYRPELKARAAELTVEVDGGLRATGDAQGVAIALRNLVDNALKFTRDRRPARVHIGATRSGGQVRLSVRDNGAGFDMRFHDRIFAIFQRLHRAEEYPGTGVGLAIVRKAMERMGGRVWAESVPGQGATFHLELPAAD